MAEIRLAYRNLFHLEAARVRGILMIEQMLASGRLGSAARPLTPEQLLAAIIAIFPSTHRGGLAVLDACEPGRAQMSIWAIFPYPQYLGAVVPELLNTGLSQLGYPQAMVDYAGPSQSGHPYRHCYRISW